MCRAVEEMINKEKAETEQKTKIETQFHAIQKLMVKKNMSFEEICDILDIPKESCDIYREMLKEQL